MTMILINYINQLKMRLGPKHPLSETCLRDYRVLHFFRDLNVLKFQDDSVSCWFKSEAFPLQIQVFVTLFHGFRSKFILGAWRFFTRSFAKFE